MSTINQERWRMLLAPDTVVVDAQRARYATAAAELDALPPQTPVAVVGGRRSDRLARRHRVRVDRSYVVMPSLQRPVAVVLVAREPLRWFTRSVLTIPPGTVRAHGLKWAVVQIMRRRPAWIRHTPAGDRIVIGVRT